MFKIVLEKLKAFFTSRLLPVSIVYIALFSVIIHRIFVLQIVEGNTNAENMVTQNTQKRDIVSTRGNIYDRNGILLAYNELAYSVVIEDNSLVASNDKKNEIIYKLVKILDSNGDEIDVDFPIVMEKDGTLKFNVSGSALTRFKKTVYTFELGKSDKLTQEQENATAQDVFDFLRYGTKQTVMFSISDEYSKEDALKIMAVRYAIFSNYPKYYQITVATQISNASVAAIKENSRDLIGIDIKQDSYRVYNDSLYFSHILGYTGKISSEEIKEKEEEGFSYKSSDYIGKSGIEEAFEQYLAGTKGSETVAVDNSNKVVSILERTEPIAGNDLYLTIDANLQKAAYHVLENKIAGILLKSMTNSMNYGTKGKSAGGILIPIYEVYFALFNNNIIDVDTFNDSDATTLEQSVYHQYEDALKSALSKINACLDSSYSKSNKASGEELEDYLDYIYKNVLVGQGIINKNSVDKEDKMFLDYTDNKTSLSAFLQYAISNNWVNLSSLNIGDEYYSTEELYKMLTDYICKNLENDSKFSKMIYKNLIFSNKLKGKEICLLLFDQGVLEYNEEDIRQLNNGYISAYEFIRSKIRSLEITPGQLALEPCSGSVIVTDPDTGGVLAMVSYPSYDNNMMANKVNAEYFSKLQANLSEPLYNKATQSKSAPGSTFKIVSSVAGLTERVVTTNEVIKDLKQFTKLSTTQAPKCWSKAGHGGETISDAIRDSCNYYFYEVGWRLGNGNLGNYNSTIALSILRKYATMFGFDSKTGIEITESVPQISDEDGVRSAIGQGSNNFAPIHLARFISTVANGGTLYNLTLLNQIKDKDGKTVLKNKNEAIRTLDQVSDSTWNTIKKGMCEVVSTGATNFLYDKLPVQVAGKTGTAQETKASPDHALFVSFAPYDNPEIAVTSVIRNGYTSANASEVAYEVYAYYYKEMSLKDIMNAGANLDNNSKISGD